MMKLLNWRLEREKPNNIKYRDVLHRYIYVYTVWRYQDLLSFLSSLQLFSFFQRNCREHFIFKTSPRREEFTFIIPNGSREKKQGRVLQIIHISSRIRVFCFKNSLLLIVLGILLPTLAFLSLISHLSLQQTLCGTKQLFSWWQTETHSPKCTSYTVFFQDDLTAVAAAVVYYYILEPTSSNTIFYFSPSTCFFE